MVMGIEVSFRLLTCGTPENIITRRAGVGKVFRLLLNVFCFLHIQDEWKTTNSKRNRPDYVSGTRTSSCRSLRDMGDFVPKRKLRVSV